MHGLPQPGFTKQDSRSEFGSAGSPSLSHTTILADFPHCLLIQRPVLFTVKRHIDDLNFSQSDVLLMSQDESLRLGLRADGVAALGVACVDN